MGSIQRAPLLPVGSDCLITQPEDFTLDVRTWRQKFAGGTTSDVGAASAVEETGVEVEISSADDAIVVGSLLVEIAGVEDASGTDALGVKMLDAGISDAETELRISIAEAEIAEENLPPIVLATGTLSVTTVTVTVETVTDTTTVVT